MEANEYILSTKDDYKNPPSSGFSGDSQRTFSLSKRCYGMGMGLIVTKLKETQLTVIALSVLVTNLFKIQKQILYTLIHLYEIIGVTSAWLSLNVA